MNAFTPTFWRPIEFIIPAAVSISLGASLPAIGSRESPLVTNAADTLERDDLLELDAVPKGAARGDHGVR